MFEYSIIKSKRKTISIQVRDDGTVVVRTPNNISKKEVERFLRQHNDWVKKKLIKASEKNKEFYKYNFTNKEVGELKKEARNRIEHRLMYWSKKLGFKYNKFRLSGAKKRWGSCSNRKTISLNWRLVFVPDEILDYIIIHELVHTRHMNHSKKFWKDVEDCCEEYKKHRKWLKENDYILRIEPND